MAKYFRVGKGPNLVIRPPSEAQIAITRLASDESLPERTAAIPCERAFVVSVHLTPARSEDVKSGLMIAVLESQNGLLEGLEFMTWSLILVCAIGVPLIGFTIMSPVQRLTHSRTTLRSATSQPFNAHPE